MGLTRHKLGGGWCGVVLVNCKYPLTSSNPSDPYPKPLNRDLGFVVPHWL